MSVQNRLGKKGEADRKTGRDPRPPERNGRPRHLLFAQSANDFVNDRRRRARSLLNLFHLFVIRTVIFGPIT
jgi:hypothetical protein